MDIVKVNKTQRKGLQGNDKQKKSTYESLLNIFSVLKHRIWQKSLKNQIWNVAYRMECQIYFSLSINRRQLKPNQLELILQSLKDKMYAPPPAYGAPYGAPPPAYGYAQPPPPPPPAFYPQQQQQGPMIINLGQNNSSGSPCGICGKDTDSIPRKKLGCVAWAWCICLLFTVGAYGLCLIPLCSDSCKDTQLVCVKCQNIKQTIPANCC